MASTMTRVRANYLLALSAWLAATGQNPRPSLVERQTLLKFEESWTDGQTGPLGKTLRAPSWLTAVTDDGGSNPYRTDRGVYNLGNLWIEVDAWVARNTPTPAPAPAAAPVADPAPAATETV